MSNRECGDCSLCCKVLEFDSMPSAANSWCKHCRPGRGGCSVYGQVQRPQECSDFECAWLKGRIPERFKPNSVKAVVVILGQVVAVYLDESMADGKHRAFARWLDGVAMTVPVVLIDGDERQVIAGSRRAKMAAAQVMKGFDLAGKE